MTPQQGNTPSRSNKAGQNNMRNVVTGLVAAAALLLSTGCHKKPVQVAAPPPPAMGDAPTAQLTASPSAIAPGQQVSLTWHTTNATDVSIDGIGPVETSGVKGVMPTSSTDYHLVAHGSGGSTDATARVTVSRCQHHCRNRQRQLGRRRRDLPHQRGRRLL